MKNLKFSKKHKNPDCIGKIVHCKHCGGESKITGRTSLLLDNEIVTVYCPYCTLRTPVDNDLLKNYKTKLLEFVKSQVSPINSIQDDNVRLPMQKLLDDFYALLQE